MLAQRFAFQQFRDHIRRPGVGAHIMDGKNVRMVERTGGLRLLLETPQAFGVGGKRGRKHLDRDIAPQSGVRRAIYLSHSAFANFGADFVAAESCAGSDAHRTRRACPSSMTSTSGVARWGAGSVTSLTRSLLGSNPLPRLSGGRTLSAEDDMWWSPVAPFTRVPPLPVQSTAISWRLRPAPALVPTRSSPPSEPAGWGKCISRATPSWGAMSR